MWACCVLAVSSNSSLGSHGKYLRSEKQFLLSVSLIFLLRFLWISIVSSNPKANCKLGNGHHITEHDLWLASHWDKIHQKVTLYAIIWVTWSETKWPSTSKTRINIADVFMITPPPIPCECACITCRSPTNWTQLYLISIRILFSIQRKKRRK